MTFKAFGKSIRDPEEYDLIRKMATVVMDESINVIDLMSFSVHIEPNDVVLVYGKSAWRQCKDYECLARVELPGIERLCPTLGETKLREEAFEKLLQLKETLDSNNLTGETTLHTKESVEDPLPTFKCDQVKAKEESTREFRGITEDGRSFKLTSQPDTKDADICMTFAELWNLKALKDMLHVKELNFVKHTTSSRKGNSQ